MIIIIIFFTVLLFEQAAWVLFNVSWFIAMTDMASYEA